MLNRTQNLSIILQSNFIKRVKNFYYLNPNILNISVRYEWKITQPEKIHGKFTKIILKKREKIKLMIRF